MMSGAFTAMPGGRSQVDTLEEWCYRVLVLAVCGMAFSIALGQTLAGIAFLSWIALIIKSRKAPPLSFAALGAVLFVAIAALTLLWSVAPDGSVRGIKGLFWFVMLPMSAMLVNTHGRLTMLLKGFVAGCSVLALEICVVRPVRAFIAVRNDACSGRGLLDEIIFRGSMTDGQMLALGILAVLGIIHLMQCEGRRRGLWDAALFLLVAGLIVNFKRGSWISVCILAPAFMAAKGRWRYVFMAAVAVGVAALLPPVRYRLASLAADSGGRKTMWTQVAPGMVKEHPWGIGYGAMSNELMRKYAPEVEPDRNHLHSNPVQILAETGWLGLAAWLAWMAAAVVESALFARRGDSIDEPAYPALNPVMTVLIPVERRAVAVNNASVLLFMLAALLLNGLVEYNFGDTELTVLYSTILGCVAAGNARGRA